MAELLVRTALTYFVEPERSEQSDHLVRLENWDTGHGLPHAYGLGSDELGIQLRLAIF